MQPYFGEKKTWYVPSTTPSSSAAVGPGSNGFPSRKDIATSYVRKLILDTTPLPVLVQCFPNVDQVEVTPYCLDEDARNEEEGIPSQSVHQFTIALASQQKSTVPLHVTFCALERHLKLYMSLGSFLDPDTGRSSTSATHLILYEIFNMTILEEIEDAPWIPLVIACKLQAVVHFDLSTRVGTVEDTVAIGRQLFECVAECLGTNSCVYGQLYLCDIPDIVLSPDEVDLADDVDKGAKLKLSNILLPPLSIFGRGQVRPKWEDFNARIHLVRSGFRPPKADMKMVNQT